MKALGNLMAKHLGGTQCCVAIHDRETYLLTIKN